MNTDEWGAYNHLAEAERKHVTVCHHDKEWARDDDGDGVRSKHHRMVAHDRVVPAERACRFSARALEEGASGRYPLCRVARGRGLGGGRLFPTEIAERVARTTTDTAENRFVKAFVASCGFVVDAMRRRMAGESTALARRVRADCAAVEGALEPIRRHRVWEEVGRMAHFPGASTVLQRRAPYREVLRHHVLMRLASKALPLHRDEVVQLLEVKDIARLSRHAGFHGRSWSRTLRPDISLWVPRGPAAGLHLLDAKLRLVGSLAGDEPSHARPDDIHKMHACRDAIPEARSAWVLYPGREEHAWRPPDGVGAGLGVGAAPVVPGEEHDTLVGFIGTMLGESSRLEVEVA